MLRFEGTVVSIQNKEMNWTNRKGEQKSRKFLKVWCVDGDRAPEGIRCDEKFKAKVGEVVKIPVYVSTFKTRDGGVRYEFVQLVERNNGNGGSSGKPRV